MTQVPMRALLRSARLHRQDGLVPFQRLNLRPLVDAEDDRVRRRKHVQADDIHDLVHEVGVVGEPKVLGSARLGAGQGNYSALNHSAIPSSARTIAQLTPAKMDARRAASFSHQLAGRMPLRRKVPTPEMFTAAILTSTSSIAR